MGIYNRKGDEVKLWVAYFNRIVKVSVLGKVMFKQRLESDMVVSLLCEESWGAPTDPSLGAHGLSPRN